MNQLRQLERRVAEFHEVDARAARGRPTSRFMGMTEFDAVRHCTLKEPVSIDSYAFVALLVLFGGREGTP